MTESRGLRRVDGPGDADAGVSTETRVVADVELSAESGGSSLGTTSRGPRGAMLIMSH